MYYYICCKASNCSTNNAKHLIGPLYWFSLNEICLLNGIRIYTVENDFIGHKCNDVTLYHFDPFLRRLDLATKNLKNCITSKTNRVKNSIVHCRNSPKMEPRAQKNVHFHDCYFKINIKPIIKNNTVRNRIKHHHLHLHITSLAHCVILVKIRKNNIFFCLSNGLHCFILQL